MHGKYLADWAKKIIGYGAVAASGAVATKVGDPEIGAWVGSTIALIGGLLLNKALPWVFLSRRRFVEHQVNNPEPPKLK